MFSFSAYSTSMPFGGFTSYDTDMIAPDSDIYYDNSYNVDEEQHHNGTALMNSELGQPIISHTVNNMALPKTYSGGTMELLDYETGEVSRLHPVVLQKQSTSSHIHDAVTSSTSTELAPFGDTLVKEKKPIWLPPRDAETGQPLYYNSRGNTSSAAISAGPSHERRPASEACSMSVDVDSLLNSFDMNDIDLTSLDREVSLAELGNLLNDGSNVSKCRFGADYHASAPELQLRQPAVDNLRSVNMLDTADDIMMPVMANMRQESGSQQPQQRSSGSSSNESVMPFTQNGNWSRGEFGSIAGGGVGNGDDDGSGQRRNGMSDAAIFGCAADAGGACSSAGDELLWQKQQQPIVNNSNNNNDAVTVNQSYMYTPLISAGDQRQQQTQQTFDPATASNDEMLQWLSSPASFAYDFGQESFVLPTMSQAWRNDFSYFGAFSPAPVVLFNQDGQQEQQHQQMDALSAAADYIMPIPDDKADFTYVPLQYQEQQPSSSSVSTHIDSLLSPSSWPLVEQSVTDSGFVMQIKEEAMPFAAAAGSSQNLTRSRRSSGKTLPKSTDNAAADSGSSRVARSLEVATFRDAERKEDEEGSVGSSQFNGAVRTSIEDGSELFSSNSKRILRDRKLVEEHKFPFSYDEIVWMAVDEFNNVLISTSYSFTQKQRDLLKDIRRRGKNKVAARNCRRRKVDQIDSLDEVVRTMRDKRERADDELQRVDANFECAIQVLAVLRRSLDIAAVAPSQLTG